MAKKTLDLSPVTRLEGHLDFKVELEGNKVSGSYSSGALIRGFEVMLKGRHPHDALVLVPRICGVCPTSHQIAAVTALDKIHNAEVPPNGRLIRTILLALEHIYSHAAHFYVLFGPDLANKKYNNSSLKDEVDKRFAGLSGSSYLSAIEAKRLLNSIYAILGGQFPHSNVFIPGGVTSRPTVGNMVKINVILRDVLEMIETMVLGCSAERWLENKTLEDVQAWLGEKEEHGNGDLGVFIKYGLEIELNKLGQGPFSFLAYPCFEEMDGTFWLKGGHISSDGINELSADKIAEEVKYSWSGDYSGSKHPFEGETNITKTSDDKYSYLKAVRYGGNSAQVGPLARMLADGDPLVKDLGDKLGVNVLTRELARLHEAVRLLAKVRDWIGQINLKEPSYIKPTGGAMTGEAVGLTEAPRGALGHWIKVEDGVIANYQIITPTAWNASPRDENNMLGPLEEAVLGIEIADSGNPIEVQHVIRSFDPCLACAVHVVKGNKTYNSKII